MSNSNVVQQPDNNTGNLVANQKRNFDLINTLKNVPEQLIKIMELVEKNQVETIIRTTLLGNKNITTVDIKLPRMKEDRLYEHVNIRFLVPRGLCFIFVDNQFIHSVQGHPKFGNYGDFQQKNANTNYSQRIFRRKENGECGHFTAFTDDNIKYLVFGSKNVHFVIRMDYIDEDLKLYETEPRYMFAHKIAKLATTKYLQSLIQAQDYCSQTKFTMDFEACFGDSQHLVKYDSDTLYFFAITGARETEKCSLTSINPLVADDIFRSFNLPTVTITNTATTDEEIKKIEHIVENDDNSEGAVVNCIDNNGNVIYVYKHKNYTYVFRRAVREQMRKKASMKAILRRLSVLHIQHPNAEALTQEMLQFNAYYRLLPASEQHIFFSQWVTHEEKFNTLNNNQKQELLKRYSENVKKNGTLTVYMIVAMPGSGKSYLARALKQLFSKYMDPNTIVHLEQDMFVQSHDKNGKNASKAYDDAIKKAMNDPKTQMLILAKSNHNKLVRNKTYDLLDKCPREIERVYITITCTDESLEQPEQLQVSKNICIERIKLRGNAHTSMVNLNDSEIANIMDSVFVKQWEPLSDEEQQYPCVSLDISASREQNLISCIAQLYENGITDKYEFKTTDLQDAHNTVLADDAKILNHNIANPNNSQKKSKVLYDELAVQGMITIPDLDKQLDFLVKKCRISCYTSILWK